MEKIGLMLGWREYLSPQKSTDLIQLDLKCWLNRQTSNLKCINNILITKV